MTYPDFVAWLKEAWPNPPGHVLDNLRHTLDTYDSPIIASQPKDDEYALVATTGVYQDEAGRKVKTGLTWGDLRKIREVLEFVELTQRTHPFKYLVLPKDDASKATIR